MAVDMGTLVYGAVGALRVHRVELDLISFFTERVDLTVDGVDIPRPVTPWS
jgi:transaldolase